MDEMVHHCKAVQRGSKGAFLLGDMPFGSFEVIHRPLTITCPFPFSNKRSLPLKLLEMPQDY